MAEAEPFTREELRDLLAEAISDSLDMDWQPSWAADSILGRLDDEGLAIGRPNDFAQAALQAQSRFFSLGCQERAEEATGELWTLYHNQGGEFVVGQGDTLADAMTAAMAERAEAREAR